MAGCGAAAVAPAQHRGLRPGATTFAGAVEPGADRGHVGSLERTADQPPDHLPLRPAWLGASWEKACVVTVVERVTGLLLVGKSPDRTVRSVNKVLQRLLRQSPLPVRTLTLDNGTEFHGYREVQAATGVQIYFARPHHPWQRGSNENTNGLLRQYWPKRTSMEKLSQRQCDQIAHRINTRPRKRNGYLSPLQLIP